MPAASAKPFESDAAHRRPAVLVGIVTRNRAAILRKAIQSTVSQSYPRVQVAVWDDASEDGTSELQMEFPELHWYHSDRPRGYREARNALMRAAQADYYLSLDDDAWFVNGAEIALAIRHLEHNPKSGAVAFDILSPDRPQSIWRGSPLPVHSFIGCGHVVRLRAVRECGFYLSSPGLYGSEEKDLCLRLLDRGWEVHLLPGVHVWHDKSAAARDQTAQHCSGVCNDLVFAIRRCPLPMLFVVLPGKLLKHLAFAFRHHLLKPCLAGFRLVIAHAPEIWRTRRPVRVQTFREFIRRGRAIV